MNYPSKEVVGRFLVIVIGLLLIDKLVRLVFFEGLSEALGGIDIAFAIGAAVAVTGGWLQSTSNKS